MLGFNRILAPLDCGSERLQQATRRSPEPQGHHRKVGKLTFNFAESRLSFLTPESRERSFSRENHLFKLAVGTAAQCRDVHCAAYAQFETMHR